MSSCTAANGSARTVADSSCVAAMVLWPPTPVLYLRSGRCVGGPEVRCNDDACTNSTGLFRASRITATVTAGQTYLIVVDGYSGRTGPSA